MPKSYPIIEMRYADQREASYGILYVSVNVHKIIGAKHNRNAPHRVTVWSNTDRPNPHPGETRWNASGSIGGDGAYLDPGNRGTDDEITVQTSAEPVCITSSGTNTGTAASGQVYGEVLAVGGQVLLRLPADAPHGPYMGRYTIDQRPLHDPHLTQFVR